MFFQFKRKQGVNNCFKYLILSVFNTIASRLKSEKKGKGKINLETKYKMIQTNQSLTLYKINQNFPFSSNTWCYCVIIFIFLKVCVLNNDQTFN